MFFCSIIAVIAYYVSRTCCSAEGAIGVGDEQTARAERPGCVLLTSTVRLDPTSDIVRAVVVERLSKLYIYMTPLHHPTPLYRPPSL